MLVGVRERKKDGIRMSEEEQARRVNDFRQEAHDARCVALLLCVVG